jgi:glycosyltransferase involved in cell wall biosynthesis
MEDRFNNSICILNNTLNPGGAEKNCVVICNELAKKGIYVELWITRLGNTPLIELLDNRVKIRIIPGKRVRYALVHLKKMMVNCKSKTFLVFNMELLVPAFFINKIYHLNLKIVARSISTLSLAYDQQGYLGKKIWFQLISYSVNKIDRIIAQSSGMKEDMVKYFKISESKITIIPNPAYNFLGPIIDSKEYNINFYELLFVGRLTEDKGLNYLLEIFSIALNYLPDLHLTIVGKGELEKMVKTKIIELGLSKSISMEGFQTDLSPYYKKAKATILTSVREGFPNVLVESISLGTPIISFDCPSGPRDIIIQNVNGILIEHLNVREFAKAIVDVVKGNIKFDKLMVIESARRFNLDGIIRQYENVLFES